MVGIFGGALRSTVLYPRGSLGWAHDWTLGMRPEGGHLDNIKLKFKLNLKKIKFKFRRFLVD
jgi:hypothetical protein